MIVVTAEQMREMDRLTIQKYGVPSLILMERAGQAIAQTILERFSRHAKKGVLVEYVENGIHNHLLSHK